MVAMADDVSGNSKVAGRYESSNMQAQNSSFGLPEHSVDIAVAAGYTLVNRGDQYPLYRKCLYDNGKFLCIIMLIYILF